MRLIKCKERKRAGNIYCDYCRPKKVHAIWRKIGICSAFACEDHKGLIPVESDRMTEADYQTWGRL